MLRQTIMFHDREYYYYYYYQLYHNHKPGNFITLIVLLTCMQIATPTNYLTAWCEVINQEKENLRNDVIG